MGVSPAGDVAAMALVTSPAAPGGIAIGTRGAACVLGSQDDADESPARKSKPNARCALEGADTIALIASTATVHLVSAAAGAVRASSHPSSETPQFIDPDVSSRMKTS